MKATFKTKETKNGIKYIYSVDGKQVRTSMKPYAYEYVAVSVKDGKFDGIFSCGKLKTCESWLSWKSTRILVGKTITSLYKGEITYNEYFNIVGFNNALCKSYFRDELEEKGREALIAHWEKFVEDEKAEQVVILKFEQE